MRFSFMDAFHGLNWESRVSRLKLLVDPQVNGLFVDGEVIDFSSPTLNVEKIEAVTKQLVDFGTMLYCPTVITTDPGVYSKVLTELAKAMDTDWGRRHILGIHLEGPFLNPKDGPRGAHPAEFICPPSISQFDKLFNYARGKLAWITVAPEMPGAVELISHARDLGVVVSFGHHVATYDQLEAGVRAGASCSTHIGNACPHNLPRHSEQLIWQMSRRGMYGMFIADGVHIPREFLLTGIHAKGPQHAIVTSDVSAAGRAPNGRYQIFSGLEVEVKNGRVCSPDNGERLAGSWSVQMDCMNWLAELQELSEEQLWDLGGRNTLRLLRPSLKRLARTPSDFASLSGKVVFEHGQFHVR